MSASDHHDWVRLAANELMCGGDTLWQAMCAEWVQTLDAKGVAPIIQRIEDALE